MEILCRFEKNYIIFPKYYYLLNIIVQYIIVKKHNILITVDDFLINFQSCEFFAIKEFYVKIFWGFDPFVNK